MNCYLGIKSRNKAKNDIDEIMAVAGFRDLAISFGGNGKVAVFFSKLFSVLRLPFVLHRNDTLLIQYPFKKYYSMLCRIARMKGAYTVTLIHDLGTFRRHKLTASQEIKRLSHTDCIIVHNFSMKSWLKEHGCRIPMCELGIFDYLASSSPAGYGGLHDPRRVIYAGALGVRKNAFLYDLDEHLDGCVLDVYGRGLDETAASAWRNIHYHGFVDSDKFIESVDGDWGLVWDGDTIDECSGNWGEYLRINNPHKTSFYLCAGLPVIMWDQSAMAQFIMDNKLGICVSSLAEMSDELRNISNQEYDEIKASVGAFREKLCSGYFFRRAFDEACSVIAKRKSMQ